MRIAWCLTFTLTWGFCLNDAFNEDSAVLPFAGAPRGYGIPFPSEIAMYYTGKVDLHGNDSPQFQYVEVANSNFSNGRSFFIPFTNAAINTQVATEFGSKVGFPSPLEGRRLLLTTIGANYHGFNDAKVVSTSHALYFNTSHPALSNAWRSMIKVPGRFRIRVGGVNNCNLAPYFTFVPWGQFGFSTLPWSRRDIQLLAVRPSLTNATTFIIVNATETSTTTTTVSPNAYNGWPRHILMRYNTAIAFRDIRQIRYEVTSLSNPKETLIFRFDHLVPDLWPRPSIIFPPQPLRRLLSVSPTPGTPCLEFCVDPSSLACQACCVTVVHEVPWSCGEDSGAQCCKSWNASCWDTPAENNIQHSCNMCTTVPTRNQDFVGLINRYATPAWMSIQSSIGPDADTLVIDNQQLASDSNFPGLRKALLYTGVSVKLVVERGAVVDAFSESTPNSRGQFTFQVNPLPIKVFSLLDGRSVQKLPSWINFTISAPVTWRCATEMRGFGIQHDDLAGGGAMHPGDLCRFPVVRDSPPPTNLYPSTASPSKAPSRMPTGSPSTERPNTASPRTAIPTVSTSSTSPTASPNRLPTRTPTSPTASSTNSPTESPTSSPTPQPVIETPTLSPTLRPTSGPTMITLSPTTDSFAPRNLPCDPDSQWPTECPFPQYIHLLVDNGTTTIAVDTNDELFKQDFTDLDKVSGSVSVFIDEFALVSEDAMGLSIPAIKAKFVISPTNNEGIALTSSGVVVLVGQNSVVIPAGTARATAVVETVLVPPPSSRNIPPPISNVVRIVIVEENNTVEIENLEVPVQIIFSIPAIVPVSAKKWTPCQSQVYYRDPTCVWWDETARDWSTSGCSTKVDNATLATCKCNHLTDFAVLHALETCQEVDPLPYYVFAGPFFCVFLYCLWASIMLFHYRRTKKKAGWNSLVGQHFLMAIASIARALGPLAILPGVGVGTTSTLFALPYLAKFPSFLLLVFQWATITHFAMQTGGGRKYMMSAFTVCCVLIDLTVAGLFIYFHSTEELQAVLTGTIVLAVLAGAFASAFMGYAYFLARSFPKDASSSSNKKVLSLRMRVQVGGFAFAMFFITEAICHPVALYWQQQNVAYGLMGATVVFLLAEFLSYVTILWLFYPALTLFINTANETKASGTELGRTNTQSKLSVQSVSRISTA